MNILIYCIGIIVSYLVGTFSTSLVISKIKGKDIRSAGSGNLGASNTTLLLGWKWGVLVGLVDILKGTACVLAARLIFPDLAFLPYVCGVACVLGHIFPFYLKGKGGKGFATFLGMSLGLDWRFFIAIGLCIILITLITDFIVIATVTTMLSLPVYIGITTSSWINALIVAIASAVILYKHKENYPRIIKGEEYGLRASFNKKNRL